MTTAWVAAQLLLSSARATSPQVPRMNPRPAGVIRPGSATHRALAVLAARPKRSWTHAQLLTETASTTKALCWALAFLRETGLVETTRDYGRNVRYLSYRVTPKGVEHAKEIRLVEPR